MRIATSMPNGETQFIVHGQCRKVLSSRGYLYTSPQRVLKKQETSGFRHRKPGTASRQKKAGLPSSLTKLAIQSKNNTPLLSTFVFSTSCVGSTLRPPLHDVCVLDWNTDVPHSFHKCILFHPAVQSSRFARSCSTLS